MSREGKEAAADYSKQLPRYASPSQAQQALYAERDRLLSVLSRLELPGVEFEMSYKPESLKPLETAYYCMLNMKPFANGALDKSTMESCMSMYFGETAVRNSENTEWIVEEFPFSPGTYGIGIKRGLMSIMLTVSYQDLNTKSGNKNHDLLYRNYERYFGKKGQ